MSHKLNVSNEFGLGSSRTRWQMFSRWISDYKWLLLGLLWLAVIALGYRGLNDYYRSVAANNTDVHYWWDNLYGALQMFKGSKGEVFGSLSWELQLARFLAPALAIYTSLLGLAAIFREQFQLLRLRFIKSHIVICGLGDKGLPLAEGFLAKGRPVVVIDRNRNNTNAPQLREKGAIVLTGNAADPDILHKARLSQADYLIATSDEDGTNAEIAFQARRVIRNRRGKALACLVHIYDANLSNLLQGWEFGETGAGPLRLEFFNIFESGARALLEQHSALIKKIAESAYPQPHVVIIGLGQMGSSLAVNLVRRWESFQGHAGRRLGITVIDIEAEKKTRLLLSRYPELAVWSRIIPRQMEIKSAEFENADFLQPGKEWNPALAVFICLDEDAQSISAALTLHQRSRESGIPIIMRMVRESGLGYLLSGKSDSYHNIQAFSLVERTCKPDLIFGCMYETLARVIHEIYLENEKSKSNIPVKNPAVVNWEELTDDLKESNRAQAQHIRTKLRSIGYDLRPSTSWHPAPYEFNQDQLKVMAILEHERFVRERLDQGWRPGAPGRPKELQRKTNPTLVGWDKLPLEEQQKDILFAASIPVILARAGFEVYPVKQVN
jgi:hypothetical protein